MKNFLLAIFLIAMPFLSFSQEEQQEDKAPPPVMELITLFPKSDAGDALKESMKAHNDMYHKEGPFQARVYSPFTGDRIGQLFWVMGPTSWTAMENRPSEGGHDEDWAKNITPHMERPPIIEYIKLDTKRSFFPADFSLNNIYIWWIDLKPFQSYRFEAMLDDILDVYKESIPDQPYGVYWNTLGDSDSGNDVMIAWYFDSLEWMDTDREFAKKFIDMKGPGEWVNFLDEWRDILDGSETFLISHQAEMGGADPLVKVADRQ